MSDNIFYKENKKSKVWWVYQNKKAVGEFLFSFDKKKIYNLFRDYPWNMTLEEVLIFDDENPFWKEFFMDRKR